jgi:hypothetical protein
MAEVWEFLLNERKQKKRGKFILGTDSERRVSANSLLMRSGIYEANPL